MSHFALLPGALEAALLDTTRTLGELHFHTALQTRDLDVWSSDEDIRTRIANRLGWVEAVDFARGELPRLQACAEMVRDGGFTDVVLLGMGGSSLGPEVLRQVIGVADGFPRFRMLDSVDPDTVRDAMSAAPTSLFVFASKSGGTIEPNAMAAEARRRVEEAGFSDWGSRFVAITDEGTALHRLAQEQRFREIYVNPSNIGGRYSALSFFGMVPAAMMGIDVAGVLERAAAMADQCFMPDMTANPGLALGALMAAGAKHGRDKLTLLLPPRLSSFGLWVEQLVAESTGKQGKGVVPITGEPADAAAGDDRIVVAVHLPDEPADAPMDAARREALRAAGTPMLDIDMPDALSLGAEFFRWEVATAAAGRLLDINPFDEPNVQQAKDATRVLLDAFKAQRRLPFPEPHASVGGARFTMSAAAQEAAAHAGVAGFLRSVKKGDYLALLAYLPSHDAAIAQQLASARASLGTRAGCPTIFGYGPRYLHSTGQLHKGGANTGIFIIVMAPPAEDLAIPGEPFSFGTLEQAQGLGDFQSLERTGRRALLIQLPSREPQAIARAFAALS
ncbi:MAG: glucose-6-phosphate isomerase [Vicinamibacterales bacterium]